MPYTDDEIFGEALKLNADESRFQLMRSMCAADETQFERLVALLNTHRCYQENPQKSSILDRADEIYEAFAADQTIESGQRIGPYELLKKIGEGGTAVVFHARQNQPLTREVAIKLIKPGMDSRQILARFALERQTLVQLEHPGITRILDAGSQSLGRPFFAMELVKDAVTITEYCSINKLDLNARLELLLKVCEAVQYAHQHGFIHRDLKPSNILIENSQQADPQPKVIDFGIAKMFGTDSDTVFALTSLGERFGTPAYMSPEQALQTLDGIDVRSDVYSLGVVFYELLTGETPFSRRATELNRTAWTDTTFWQQTIQSPSKRLSQNAANLKDENSSTRVPAAQTSKVRPKIDVEIDWICLKALAHDRADRYQSVAEFSRDLQRFLAGEPIDSADFGAAYRLRKFVYRNLVFSTAALSFVLLLLSVAIGGTLLARKAYLAELKAQGRLSELTAVQQRLSAEHDEALAAREHAEALLKSIQMQQVMSRTLAKQIVPMIDSADSEFKLPNIPDRSSELNLNAFSQPHQRLHIQGDWRWASNSVQLQVESINAVARLRSREIARAVGTQPPPDSYANIDTGLAQGAMPPKRDEPTTPARLSFQQLLLNELTVVFKENDLFRAEVLDNCALYLMDLKEFAGAEEYLQRSYAIWNESGDFPGNAAQSRIFLIECLIERETVPATIKDYIEDVKHLLAKETLSDAGMDELRKHFYELLKSDRLLQSGAVVN